MTRRPPQLLADDLPIFTGTPIYVPDPERRKPEAQPKTTPPVSTWDWCGSLLDLKEEGEHHA